MLLLRWSRGAGNCEDQYDEVAESVMTRILTKDDERSNLTTYRQEPRRFQQPWDQSCLKRPAAASEKLRVPYYLCAPLELQVVVTQRPPTTIGLSYLLLSLFTLCMFVLIHLSMSETYSVLRTTRKRPREPRMHRRYSNKMRRCKEPTIYTDKTSCTPNSPQNPYRLTEKK